MPCMNFAPIMPALATIAGCILLIEQRLIGASFKRLLLIGGLFGLAMIIKPPTFIATIMLMGACLVMATAADWHDDPPKLIAADLLQWYKGLLRGWGIIILVTALIAFPHYYLAWHSILTYIYDNMFGRYREIWVTKGSFKFHFWYYLKGPHKGKYDSMLGGQVFVIGAILIGGVIHTLFQKDRRKNVRLLAFALLLAGTFVMGVINPVKSFFLGLTFQTCMVLLAVRFLGYFITQSNPRHRLYIFSCAATIAAVMTFQWPERWSDYNSALAISRRHITNGVFDTIVAHKGVGLVKVFIMGVGDVNSAVENYRAIQRQEDIEFYGLADSTDMAPSIAEWDRCDYIVASQKDTKVTAGFLLGHQILDDLLAKLRERKDFREIGFFPYVYSGRGYFVFEKVRN